MKQKGKPQAQKAYVQRVQQLRRGSATSPRPAGNDYKRKPKHSKRGWE